MFLRVNWIGKIQLECEDMRAASAYWSGLGAWSFQIHLVDFYNFAFFTAKTCICKINFCEVFIIINGNILFLRCITLEESTR